MINVPVLLTLVLTFEEIFIEGFPDSESIIWVVVTLLLLYLVAATNYNMLCCSLVDPGIIPSRVEWKCNVA